MTASSFVDLRHAKPTSRPLEKRAAAKAKRAAWQAIRRLVLARDGHRCRVCQMHATSMDVHHVRARALGGLDAAENLLSLCRGCHAARHHGLLEICSIDAQDRVTFRWHRKKTTASR